MCTIFWMLCSTGANFDRTVKAVGVVLAVVLDLIVVILYSLSTVTG